VERFAFRPWSDGVLRLAWIETLAGHRLEVHYDAQARPVKVVQGLEGRVFELAYDERNLLRSVAFVGDADQRSVLVRYAYDDARRLVTSTDALGNENKYAYDDQHRLIAETNALGSTFRFRYDDRGRCVFTSGDARYMERRLQYLSVPHLTRVTNSRGYTTQYFLNPAGQVVQEISPLGNTTTNEFDEYGRIVKSTYPNGGVVRHEYDARGNRSALIDEVGATSRFEHSDLHLLTEYVDPTGAKWTCQYDACGNLLARTNPLGQQLACVRDHRGLVVESRRPGGLRAQRRYGSRLRSVEVSDQISLVLKVEVDSLGRQTALYDAKGLRHRIRNDALGRPVETTDALGRTSRLRYNGNHDLVERVLPGHVAERWDYDGFGRVVRHSNFAGVMRLEYDTEDHLVAVTNRAGDRLTRGYDADGRLVMQTFFDGRTERYEYGPGGFRTRLVRSDGRTVAYTYDKAGQLLGRESSDGLKEEFSYDAKGKLVLARNAVSAVELIRDLAGRVVAEVQNGRRVEYRFDDDNNRVGRRIDGFDGSDLSLRYDLRGRLVGVADVRGDYQALGWDDGDQLQERRLAGGCVERFAYDAGRRMREHDVFAPSGPLLLGQRFVYDDADNIVVRDDTRRGRRNFEYDAISRLVRVGRDGRLVESYEYDASGTLLRTHDGPLQTARGGRVESDQARRFEYGADGCVAAIESDRGRRLLEHDVDGKLVGVTEPGGEKLRYSYDALGRRIAKDDNGKRTEFVWHSCDLAAEVKEGAAPTMYFHYNQVPLAQWNNGQRQTPVLDPIGLPLALLDERGQTIWEAGYQAYGLLTSEKGAGTCPFRFRGQYHDRETGFHYNFYRHYDPVVAGYLAPDPIGLGGGSNFYAYPRNPLLWDDPFGLTCTNKHKGQMGEAEMDAYFAGMGYTKLGSHDSPHGGGPGRPQGIDGVYHNPNGNPQYIIAEAKYGSACLGQTTHSGQQMSDHWIDTPIGGHGPDRLTQAVGPTHAAAIQTQAASNQGSVQRQVFTLPDPGTPGTGSVTKTSNYSPGSGGTTF
jgi:RHS repeat-associated protein